MLMLVISRIRKLLFDLTHWKYKKMDKVVGGFWRREFQNDEIREMIRKYENKK